MNSFFNFSYFLKCIPDMVAHLPITIWLTVVSMSLALVVGLVAALVRIYKIPVLKHIVLLYVSFVRGTPLLVQLYLVYYGIPKLIFFLQSQYNMLPNFDINVIPPELFAILAFTSNLGAYLSETIRSAIEAVERGQFEAAKSVGMTEAQAMLRIILPQALIVALPNFGNTLISTVKDTSLIFMIAIIDVMGEAKIIGARGLSYFEVYVGVSLIYWAVCILLERMLFALENRLKVYDRNYV